MAKSKKNRLNYRHPLILLPALPLFILLVVMYMVIAIAFAIYSAYYSVLETCVSDNKSERQLKEAYNKFATSLWLYSLGGKNEKEKRS
jgi:Fe2+ transport system protein B